MFRVNYYHDEYNSVLLIRIYLLTENRVARRHCFCKKNRILEKEKGRKGEKEREKEREGRERGEHPRNR